MIDPKARKKGAEPIVERNQEITEEHRPAHRRRGHRRGARALAADLPVTPRRLPHVLRAQPGDRPAGRHRRGGGHHRRAVDRRAGHAADHAHVPHRRRRRRWTSPPACRASRSCSRRACPRARPRSATSTASSRSSRRESGGRRVKVTIARGVRHAAAHRARATSCSSPKAITSRPTRSSPATSKDGARSTRCALPTRA